MPITIYQKQDKSYIPAFMEHIKYSNNKRVMKQMF